MRPERSIGFLIRRIERVMSGIAEDSFAEQELTFSQLVSLSLIASGVAGSCSSLSRCLGHNSGATTRLLDQLEERGMITRVRDGEDRRIVTIGLGADGARALALLKPRLTAIWNAVLADFAHDEVEQLIALLGRLLVSLERYEQTGGAA